jgi:hypothetical protein
LPSTATAARGVGLAAQPALEVLMVASVRAQPRRGNSLEKVRELIVRTVPWVVVVA